MWISLLLHPQSFLSWGSAGIPSTYEPRALKWHVNQDWTLYSITTFFLRMFPFMLKWSIFIRRYGISFPRCLSKHANSLRSHLISALFTLSLSISISSLSYHPDRLVQTAIWNRFNHQTRSPVSGSSRFEEVILHLVLYFRLIFKYFCGLLITDLRYRRKL